MGGDIRNRIPIHRSSFFCLETKETKIQGLQNALAQILSNRKFGRVISSIALQSFPLSLAIRFEFTCHVLMTDENSSSTFNIRHSTLFYCHVLMPIHFLVNISFFFNKRNATAAASCHSDRVFCLTAKNDEESI